MGDISPLNGSPLKVFHQGRLLLLEMARHNDSHHRQSIDYDQVAQAYDEVRSGDKEMIEQILSEVVLDSNSTVLDVGCGTGNNTILLEDLTGARLVGLDLFLGMLREACSKSQSMTVVQAPGETMPFRDSVFHFTLMTEVLHHLCDFRTTLGEMHRILKPVGCLCIVTQSHEQIKSRMTSRFFPGTVVVDQARYPRISVVKSTLERIGFQKTRARSHTFTPVRLGRDYLSTVTRRGYSMLHKISANEFRQGLSRLRAAISDGEDISYSAGYTFVWATRRD
ncbi:class I SAM-dependent methyltransferase [Candidatus Thorarchaeota archaeon]|jgi:ubiquinone/menaquinone biosynthesis C-methylase UbiE|nr:MAG: class I SAM-dependent methyltransferase [Candidatus Thorarchaeota archaeon]